MNGCAAVRDEKKVFSRGIDRSQINAGQICYDQQHDLHFSLLNVQACDCLWYFSGAAGRKGVWDDEQRVFRGLAGWIHYIRLCQARESHAARFAHPPHTSRL